MNILTWSDEHWSPRGEGNNGRDSSTTWDAKGIGGRDGGKGQIQWQDSVLIAHFGVLALDADGVRQ